MKIRWFLSVLSFLIYFTSFSQNGADTCDNAEPMCSDNSGVKIFNNVTNIPDTGAIGCLFSTPNPAWFFIRVQSSGDLNFRIIQSSSFDAGGNPNGTPIDVDFIAWGPFNSPDSNCTSLANNCLDSSGNSVTCPDNVSSPNFYINNTDMTNIIDCSYDASSVENLTINNAQAGEFYLLLITNFDNVAGQIKLEQTNFGATGAGVTDCSIVVGELGGDQSVCNGTPVTLDGTPVSGTATSFEWQIDTGSGFTTIPGETNSTLTINDDRSGIYRVIITDNTGNTSMDDVTITYYPVPVANSVSDINFCDPDLDGFNSFDLNNLVSPQVLGTQDPNQFEVLYFLSQADADANNIPNALSNPYTNPTPNSNQTIFARIHNTLAPDTCYDTTQFNLTVSAQPTGSQAINYEVCDDVANGGDTDGFFNNFMLSTKDSEVLGSLSPTTFNVSYHTTLTGAQTDSSTDVIDKNNPYRNATINAQTIYVRIENIANTNCFTVSDPASTTFQPFQLIVHPLPVITNNPAVINQCDTDSDLSTSINLTQAEISISANHTNETFKYYPTEADAIADTAEITTPITHTASDGDSVWVRTISNQGCFRISRLDITISFAGDVAYNQEFTSCDDFLDADGNDTINNDDRDGISNFDISPAIDAIRNLFDPAIRNDLDILFFETAHDRDAVINQIPDPTNYRNTNIPATTQQSIFVKIVNRINNDCTGLGEFFIRVLPLPEFDVTTPQIVCLNNPSFIEAETPDGTYTYEWRRNGALDTSSTSETLNITQGGTYEVTAINTTTLCRRTRRIIVNESIIATLAEDDVTIIDDSANNTITIDNSNNNLGIGDYEFALQDENSVIVRDFQDTPTFENLSGGVYTILVRDKNGCGVAQLEVSVLEFPKYFTPNGDGVNDLWAVKGASTTFYPQSSIHIFDRYGNPITEIAIDGQGWDGLYNGKILPSNDYWFNIQLTDRNGITINRKGHFSLLRK